MALDAWALPYEAPISLDATRTIGTRPRRRVLWTLAALPVVPLLIACAILDWPWLAAPVPLWLLVCMVMAKNFGYRPAEYWVRAWWRSSRMPRRLDGNQLYALHAPYIIRSDGNLADIATDTPRGVVVVEQTENLRLADSQTLSTTVRKLGMFLNGLKFPVQIVVRAWPGTDGLLERRWYVAARAENQNLDAIVVGLARAGLKGRQLNGDLFDELQRCWTRLPFEGHLGPHVLERERTHVTVDGEMVRGFLLAKMPRVVEANWLAPLLDGDLPIDYSLWLDPTENADELDYLSTRINDWETGQVLNVTKSGYRDPDLDDQIKDAARTRLLLRRRELRVFRATMAFVIRGKDEATLSELEQQLVQSAREQVGDDPLIPLDFEQDRAPLLVVPLGEPAVKYSLRTVTPAVARGYMFSNSSIAHRDGVDCGTSVGSKRTNRLNLFSLANPHVVVLGTTGSGKGFWIKVFLWRLLHAPMRPERVRVFVIQAEKDEYTALAEAIEPKSYGFDRADVVRIKALADLEPLVCPDYYASPGALKHFRNLVVYDLTGMMPEHRGTAVAWLLRAIERTAEYSRSSIDTSAEMHMLTVVDELGIVIESDEAARALEIAYRRFRSIPRKDDPRKINRVAMIGASQRPSDLLRHPRGKVLADLAMTHVYFRQQPTSTDAAVLKLAPDEVSFIEDAEQGTGLLVADRSRIGFHLDATDREKAFAET